MRNILTIAGKELRSYFTSPMAYVVAVFLLLITGFLFTLGILRDPRAQTDYFRALIGTMVFLTLMMTPMLTMGLLAQEKASGTMELLMTRPVHDWEVVIGKYLGAVALFALTLVLTLEFPLILELGGEVDWGMIWTGYLGVLLAGMAFIALGLFASSLTSNQIAAAIIGVSLLLFFWLIGYLSYSVSENLGGVLKHISIFENFQDFAKGIVDTKCLIYFFSLIFVGLFLSIRSIENQRTI